jgi:nitroreductase
MEAYKAIRSRCSIRDFLDKAIPKEAIEKIVDCGRVAPTARGEGPWEFIAVTDKKTLRTIADITDYGKFICYCACAIAVFCKDTKYYLEDGCAATENMLVAATGLGIGSCWVAGDKKPYCGKIADILNVPAGYKLISMVALGYPAGPQKAIKKRPLSKVLHWEKF